MNQKPLILIVGAAVAQNESVVRHLLSSNRFRVRVVVCNAGSKKALALEEAGAEVVTGDFDDKESLLRALRGCDGVFSITNFREHAAIEYQQGKNLVDAVVESGVPQFVLSTRPLGHEALSGLQFDDQVPLELYAREKKPDTILMHLPFYYEDLPGLLPMQKAAEGSYFITLLQGDAAPTATSFAGLGTLLMTVFQNPTAFAGTTIETAGSMLPGTEQATAFQL